jgi:sulfate transport system ATP-binding protein
LDEPFGALDAKVRQELRRWLRRLHDELHITSVFVTHDQEEALEVADRIVVMNKGMIEQIGTPDEVYEHPANAFVYNFLGQVNLFHGRDTLLAQHAGSVSGNGNGKTTAAPVAYGRPHDLDVLRSKTNEGDIPVKITHLVAVGALVRLELARADSGDIISAELTREHARTLKLAVGDSVFVRPKNLRMFDEDVDYSI